MKWPMLKLHDICRPKQWPTISSGKLTASGFPVYGANGRIGYYPEFNHAEPTILITCRGATCGTINTCEPKSYVTGNSMALDDLDDRINLHFLAHYLRNRGLVDVISGSAQPQITREGLTKITVPVPSLDEQRRIAAILDKAEGLRAKRRQALAKLDTLTQSLFEQSYLEQGGEALPRAALSDLTLEFRYGTSNKSEIGEGKPTLRIPNVIGGVIDLQDLKTVPVSKEEFDRLRLCDGDLLFVRTNGNPENVGRCALFQAQKFSDSGVNAEFIFASYLIRARLDSESVNPIFVRDYLLSVEGRKQLLSYAKTSAGQFNINTDSLGKIRIPMPSLEAQKEYARRVEQVNFLKQRYLYLVGSDKRFCASLQHRAFRGEL